MEPTASAGTEAAHAHIMAALPSGCEWSYSRQKSQIVHPAPPEKCRRSELIEEDSMKSLFLIVALVGSATAQTTLFGWTLGKPANGDGRVGLGENAVLVGHHGIDNDTGDEGDDV